MAFGSKMPPKNSKKSFVSFDNKNENLPQRILAFFARDY